jgi:hypothetical protein
MGDMRNAYTILVEEPEGKIPLGRRRRKWQDILPLKEIILKEEMRV